MGGPPPWPEWGFVVEDRGGEVVVVVGADVVVVVRRGEVDDVGLVVDVVVLPFVVPDVVEVELPLAGTVVVVVVVVEGPDRVVDGDRVTVSPATRAGGAVVGDDTALALVGVAPTPGSRFTPGTRPSA